MPLANNRPLARSHRVALGNWPAGVQDSRSATFQALLAHLENAGYDGVEMGVGFFARYFPGDSLAVVASKTQRALAKAGLQVFGATLHVSDPAMRGLHWIDKVKDEIKLTQDLGGEYVSFQINLHPDYCNTGGAYRDDEEYLKECAHNIRKMRTAAWDQGMNFYVETHIDRISEDPAAFARILQMATSEVTGDLSHYLYRGITKGKHLEAILKHMGHTHVRMCRTHGDLSADVPCPQADWESRGVTWQGFQIMKAGLKGGLSSRTIVGESGPMHLVKDTLGLDQKLVPLYRAMATYADNQANGIDQKVEEPGDLRPWG
ncbi:MAG: TIM barrel protein [Planctomycetota bacterium]|nr:TIM barrel protein [Planctomycetota bacterium]